MDSWVAALFASRLHLVTHRQLLDAGVDARAIQRQVRRGDWIAVRRGVYALREVWDECDDWVGRPKLRGRAAHLTMRRQHVLSHDSAAHELELEILGRRDEPVHVTRPRVTGSRNDHGVKHHLASYRESQVEMVEGIPVLGKARTAVDIAREHGVTHGVPACDSALRAGVSRAELEAAAADMWCWPGSASIRKSIAFADGRADNVAESLGRMLVAELGIGEIDVQFTLMEGQRMAICDLRVGRHVFEIDGRIKLRTRVEGGFARRSGEEALWDEKQRQDFVTGFKLGMSRIVWDDFWGARREAAKRRLMREYDSTVNRFGTSIDDLAAYILPTPAWRRRTA